MDRQNIIIGVVAVILLVTAGAFFFWPESTEQAAVVTAEPTGEGDAKTESGGY